MGMKIKQKHRLKYFASLTTNTSFMVDCKRQSDYLIAQLVQEIDHFDGALSQEASTGSLPGCYIYLTA